MPVVVQLCVLPKGDYFIAKADVVRSCMLSKGDDIMSFMTSFDLNIRSKADDNIP